MQIDAHQLTKDQENAKLQFAMFMASEDKEFTISGPAGVGKTTLLKVLMTMKDHIQVCSLLGVKPITKWELTATTNKAAEVLALASGMKTQTIHQLLGLVVKNDHKTGKQTLVRKGVAIVEDTVIVIDEASMIDRALLGHIKSCTYNCKIIYIGDHCQLAPVKEDVSPVFTDIEPVMINQIVRSQHTPAITALCTQLRQTVEDGIFRDLKQHAKPGTIDFLDGEQAQEEIRKHFLNVPEGHLPNARILAYTNATVIGFNHWLRTERGMPLTLVEGETVVSNTASHIDGSNGMLRVEQELTIRSVGPVRQRQVDTGSSYLTFDVYEVFTDVGRLTVPADMEAFRNLLKYLARSKCFGQYHDLKDNIADLRPRDACTVHKAQGSTYHTVFVHLRDIGTCTDKDQAARMLYVACSRPTHRICFIGELPKRFQGD